MLYDICSLSYSSEILTDLLYISTSIHLLSTYWLPNRFWYVLKCTKVYYGVAVKIRIYWNWRHLFFMNVVYIWDDFYLFNLFHFFVCNILIWTISELVLALAMYPSRNFLFQRYTQIKVAFHFSNIVCIYFLIIFTLFWQPITSDFPKKTHFGHTLSRPWAIHM